MLDDQGACLASSNQQLEEQYQGDHLNVADAERVDDSSTWKLPFCK